jgi:chromate reductase, NAD(P)H dehydrogenase (quinone)
VRSEAEPMPDSKFLAFAGSWRTGSFNRKLLQVGVSELQKLGVQVEVMDLRALELPIYDGDIEASSGLPPGAHKLRERIAWAHGVLIATPEYNHSVPGGLKNAVDWVSRPPQQPFKDKVVALMGASSGMYATVRAQPHLRQSLAALGAWVLPSTAVLAKAQDAFDDQGGLKDAERQKDVQRLMEALVQEVRRRK